MSQTTLCRNFGGKEWGGATFEGGVLAGHYGIYFVIILTTLSSMHVCTHIHTLMYTYIPLFVCTHNTHTYTHSSMQCVLQVVLCTVCTCRLLCV